MPSRRKIGALLVFGLAGAAFAQRGAELVGFDAATGARAGLDVAIAESTEALLSNPAGLVNIESEWRFDLTGRVFLPSIRYEDALNAGGVQDEPFIPAPYLGISFAPEPERMGRAGDWRLGLGLIHVAGNRAKLRTVTQDFPAPEGFDREVDYVETGLHLGVAHRLTDRVAVGATLSLLYSTLDVSDSLEVPILTFQGPTPLGQPIGVLLQQQFGIDALRIGGSARSDPSFGVSATLGLLIEPADGLTLGIAYRSPSLKRDYDVDVDVDISRILGEPDPVSFPDGFAVHYDGEILDFQFPQALALGAAWEPDPDWRLAIELRWVDWSSTHDTLALMLRNGDNAGFNAFVGSDSLRVDEKLGWRDQYAVTTSVEWRFAKGFVARAGFSAQTSPIGDDSANPLAPGYTNFLLGCGIGWSSDHWSVDLAFLHAFENDRRAADSLVSSDYDGSTQTFSAESAFVTVSFFF